MVNYRELKDQVDLFGRVVTQLIAPPVLFLIKGSEVRRFDT